MGSVFLSCGHEDHKKVMGWGLYTLDYGKDGDRCIIYGQYCTSCLYEQVVFAPDRTFFTYEDASWALEEEENSHG